MALVLFILETWNNSLAPKEKKGYNALHKLVFSSVNLQYEGWFSKCALKGFTVSKSARNMKD
jgi:hypothetical protein